MAYIIAICAILTIVAVRSSFYPLKFMASISWWGLAAYIIANPFVAAGSPTQVIVLLAVIFTGLMMMFMPFWYTKTANGQESGKFKIPFITPSEEDEELERQRRHVPSRNERVNNYAQRINDAMSGERRRR